MNLTLTEIAKQLMEAQKITILTHKNPDGDTLGSASALYWALDSMGKEIQVLCSDPIPKRFSYLLEDSRMMEEQADLVVSVDVADPQLLGDSLLPYLERLNLCIDHHKSNRMPDCGKYVDADASATCEIIYQLIEQLGVSITPKIADCLYTGICTDTGCFKFSNTTANTHRIAARLIECGCRYDELNQQLFDTKSRGRVLVEQKVLEQMEYYCDYRVAMIVIPQQLIQESGIDPAELDGVAALPRQIEGVEIGVTLKERPEGGYKVSMRTRSFADASEICGMLGGGGHARAAGCVLDCNLEQAKQKLLDAIQTIFIKE